MGSGCECQWQDGTGSPGPGPFTQAVQVTIGPGASGSSGSRADPAAVLLGLPGAGDSAPEARGTVCLGSSSSVPLITSTSKGLVKFSTARAY